MCSDLEVWIKNDLSPCQFVGEVFMTGTIFPFEVTTPVQLKENATNHNLTITNNTIQQYIIYIYNLLNYCPCDGIL